MRTATLSANPFALIMDPERVCQAVAKSESLRKLSQRLCHPLDKPVIRSSSAELAAFDSKIDRNTVYLPPEAVQEPVVKSFPSELN